MNIKDIEFEFADCNGAVNNTDDCSCDDDRKSTGDADECNCNDDNDSCSYSDIYTEGPYLIDILSPEVLNGKVLDSYSLPNGNIEEIDFDLAPYHRTDNEKMSGRSIYIAGTIDGNKFELWTNKVKEVEIEFPDHKAVNLTGDNIRLYIDISIGKIISNLQAMNLDAAVDGNNNGYIEIGPDDPDGNQAIAHSLLDVLSDCFDLDNDYDNDDHDDGDDHDDDDK
jgi:hypothetical protein